MGKAITRIRTGELSLTREQIIMLSRLDDFLARTEKNIQELEQFYTKTHRIPKRGDKTIEGFDMGNAIIDYRRGKRPLTKNQVERLAQIGISLLEATIKEEVVNQVRIISDKSKEQLNDKIKKLKEEKESLLDVKNSKNKTK